MGVTKIWLLALWAAGLLFYSFKQNKNYFISNRIKPLVPEIIINKYIQNLLQVFILRHNK